MKKKDTISPFEATNEQMAKSRFTDEVGISTQKEREAWNKLTPQERNDESIRLKIGRELKDKGII